MCGTSICCVHLTCAAGDISSGSVSANLWTKIGQDLHAELVKDVSYALSALSVYHSSNTL